MEGCRLLDQCIDNILEVSVVRLEVTQKVLDIRRKLEELEQLEDQLGYNSYF